MNFNQATNGYVLNQVDNIWMRPDYAGIQYNDGDEVEERIGGLVRKAQDLSVLSAELRKYCTDWPSLYHLSNARANVLRPLEDQLKGDILEIGAGCGAITRYLGECGGQVLALEGSPRRAAIARARTRDLPNVSVVSDRFDQFDSDQKFDVITLIGVLEYANLFTQGEQPAHAMLARVRSLLKPDGILIIAIENQLGLKYFAGAPEDHLWKPMYGIEGLYRQQEPETFGRYALKSLIEDAGFPHTKFLLPFPDYKLPVVVFSEEGLIADGFNPANMIAQVVTKDRQLPQELNFSMEMAWPVIAKNQLLLDVANSFVVVCSGQATQDTEPVWLASYYSVNRKTPFCKETRFSKVEGGAIDVSRHWLSTEAAGSSAQHSQFYYLKQTKSVYQLGKPLSQVFAELVSVPGWELDDVMHFFNSYIASLYQLTGTPIPEAERVFQDMVFPGDFVDAIPDNLVRNQQGKVAFIDREWGLNAGVPFDYLLFRAVISLISGISRIAPPRDTALMTRGGVLHGVFDRLGLHADEARFAEFLELESELNNYASGDQLENFSTWLPDEFLPGLTKETTLQNYAAHLAAMDTAKTFAESLAYGRLTQIQHLEAALHEVNRAKENAEKLAINRLAETQHLQVALHEMSRAKENAEKLAINRLAEIQHLEAALHEMSRAKENAEKLAINRLAEIQQLLAQLSNLQSQLSAYQAYLTEISTTKSFGAVVDQH